MNFLQNLINPHTGMEKGHESRNEMIGKLPSVLQEIVEAEPKNLNDLESALLQALAAEQRENPFAYSSLLGPSQSHADEVDFMSRLAIPGEVPHQDPESNLKFTKPTIVICLDGTGNSLTNSYPTNVVIIRNLLFKLFGTMPENLSVLYYDGVGTSGSILDIWDRIWAWSLEKRVSAVLKDLATSYRVGTDIVIFGFSRGAYAARSLAGFIEWCGIPNGGVASRMDLVFQKYLEVCAKANRSSKPTKLPGAKSKIEKVLGKGSYEFFDKSAGIAFLGLFDTVTGVEKSLYDRHNLFHVSSKIRRSCQLMATNVTHYFPPVSFHCSVCDKLDGLNHCVKISDPEAAHQEYRVLGDHSNIGGGWANRPDIEMLTSNYTLRLMLKHAPSPFPEMIPFMNNIYPAPKESELGKYVKSVLDENDMKDFPNLYLIYTIMEEFGHVPSTDCPNASSLPCCTAKPQSNAAEDQI